MICVWDLRTAERTKPCLLVAKAHHTEKPVRRRSKLRAPLARGVTSLLYSGVDEYGLISGGSYDGCAFKSTVNRLESNPVTEFCDSGTCDISTANSTSDKGIRIQIVLLGRAAHIFPQSTRPHTTVHAVHAGSRASCLAQGLHVGYSSH